MPWLKPGPGQIKRCKSIFPRFAPVHHSEINDENVDALFRIWIAPRGGNLRVASSRAPTKRTRPDEISVGTATKLIACTCIVCRHMARVTPIHSGVSVKRKSHGHPLQYRR